MGTINNGTQTVIWDYKQPIIASEINKWFYTILKAGVYDGGALTIDSGNNILIAPLHVIAETSTNQAVHINTSTNATLTISETTPYVTCQFSWADSETNYMDFTAKAVGDILTTDVVLGMGVYVLGTLTSFDYTAKTYGKNTSNTFTPKIKGNTVSGIGTYTTQKGRYTKNDDDIFFGINLEITNHTGSGTIIISDLPFTCGTGIDYPCNIVTSNLTYNSGSQISAVVSAGTSDILLKQFASGVAYSGINIDKSFYLSLSGYYSTENS